MTIVVHHNPKCGTSRNTIELIREAGIEPIVIEYLKTGWTRPYLRALFAVAGVSPKDVLRVMGTQAEELGLTKDDVDDDTILDAMVADPILVNRPIVCSPKGVALCRPKEKVLDLLP